MAIWLRISLPFPFPDTVPCYRRLAFLRAKVSLAYILLTWNNPAMIIGDRLRALREDKTHSQSDIGKRTGLLRCSISRVENVHTVLAIETLQILALALEC